MGCDIHSRAERKNADGKWEVIPGIHPFDGRSYGMYGFLAGVRNYSAVTPIAEARGIPEDAPRPNTSDEDEFGGIHDLGDHSFSWLSVAELRAFDYNQPMEDRRVTRQTSANSFDGGCTAEPGGGEMTTYREFLGSGFFRDLQKLVDVGAERVVFGFDS